MPYGTGLLKGLGITFRHHMGRKVTRQYPEQRPVLPPRSRGSLTCDIESCRACGNCVRLCPNHAISVEPGRDADGKRRSRTLTISLERCMLCGLCVENCPAKCLSFSSNFELACFRREQCIRVLRRDIPVWSAAPKPAADVPADSPGTAAGKGGDQVDNA